MEVSLAYLVGDVLKPSFDKRMTDRLQNFELLSEEDKSHLFALIDTFLHDAKTTTSPLWLYLYNF
ncbi:hypothetical protein TPENAI_60282 [Tenacibaculum litopenaei]|uniref:hypothetical protein n=1 Tax=Tenacibaculum litopenaei TaxID=396016 RepID=UPI003896256F